MEQKKIFCCLGVSHVRTKKRNADRPAFRFIKLSFNLNYSVAWPSGR